MTEATSASASDALEPPLRWLLYVRLASSSLVLASLLTVRVAHPDLALELPMGVCVAELIANAVWWLWIRTGRAMRVLMHAQFLVDVATVTVGVIHTGGLASPFLSLYVLIVTCTGLIDLQTVITYAVLTVGCLCGLLLTPSTLDWPGLSDAIRAGGIAVTTTVVLANTAFVMIHFRRRTLTERDALRALTSTLQSALDETTRYEREQRALNQRLTQSMQTRSQFIAMMSHELRTPLNSVIGFADLMLEPSVMMTEEERRTFLTHIQRGGRNLLTIIDNLIDLSRLGAGASIMRHDAMDIGRVAHDTCDSQEAEAARRGVRLTRDIAAALPPMEGDAKRVRQVLDEVIDNALRFTTSGGTVTVAAHAESDGVKIRVIDTGCGIPRDHLDRIFEPFHQVDASTRRKHNGTGLGLAVAHTFVEAMGGRIRVESEVGRGTSMEIFLPLTPPDASRPEEQSAPLAPTR